MNSKVHVNTTATNTGGQYMTSGSVAVSGHIRDVAVSGGGWMSAPKADVEKAVYAYIRALRALGRTSVNTLEVARALGIRPSDVDNALGALKSKGVKVAA